MPVILMSRFLQTTQLTRLMLLVTMCSMLTRICCFYSLNKRGTQTRQKRQTLLLLLPK